MNPATSRRRLLRQGALLAPSLLLVPDALLAQARSSDDRGGPLPALGSPLRLPAYTSLQGQRIEPAQADGQILVLYWWASWCPFCALQSPDMEKLWQAQRGRGLQMLALSIDRQPDDAKAYLAKRGYSFPAAMVTPESARLLPKPRGLPVTLVRGRDGKVLMAEAGQLFPEDVESIARFL